jgi:hypothetical protein
MSQDSLNMVVKRVHGHRMDWLREVLSKATKLSEKDKLYLLTVANEAGADVFLQSKQLEG